MFNNLPSKSIIFIDSNIFIYHFLDMSENCTYLLKRTENDSINLSIMKSNGIKNIATNDSDFDDVKEIKVWKP